ncbi:MAG: type II 3-dehydroquinate dehydratase [Actinomycetota bacterium]|nr:type II 3-dehydroquinate dehydratase [Actinomycetota bacterium]
MRIVVINGPNLNLIGTRSPEIYGSTSLQELDASCRSWAADLGAVVDTYQSNHEGDLIDRLHAAREADGVVINPGAFTHYSYAIRDAIEAIGIPTVEVHISNVRDRESWRRVSVVSDVCVSTVFGRGIIGYRDAIRHLVARAAWPVETIEYGPDPDNAGDLRIPHGPGPHPVAVLLHGGFWRNTVARDLLDAAAVDLTERGWATWNVEFVRVGGGGGWRATTADVATAIRSLVEFAEGHDLDLDRVVVVGHGSGGQLALQSAVDRGEPPISAVVALAPIADLETAHEAGIGDDAVNAFARRTPEQAPERYAAASPIKNLPIGVPLLIVTGDEDDRVPATISREFAGQAADAGDTVVYHELEGVGHGELIDPATRAWSKVAEEIDRLR